MMTFTPRHLFTASVLVLAILAPALFVSSQVATKPQPVSPVVLTGNDIGFRMTSRKGGTRLRFMRTTVRAGGA